MKLVSILGITLAVAAMTLMEWPKLGHLHREKMAFAVFSVFGYILAVLLVLYPDLPGPTQLFTVIFKPFAKILEK